jgi:hypothetical protein
VRLLGLAAAAIGAGLLVLTVRQVGWAAIVGGVTSVGGWFLVVVALGGLRFLARARSWCLCVAGIGAPPLSAARAFGAVLAGDAVGNLTPLGLLASEPAKVLLVRPVLATGPALTSVALDNGVYTGSVLVMIAAGAAMLVRQVALDPQVRLAAEAVLVAVAGTTLAAFWLARRQPAVLSWVAHHAARLAGRTAGSADALAEVEQQFYGVLAWPAGRLWQAAAWQAAFHAGAVLEVWVILRALSGATISLADAFVLESAGRLVTVLFKVVPFRIGVDEAGSAIVATALGIPASHGVTIALVRKLRILLWNAAGLVVLARARR